MASLRSLIILFSLLFLSSIVQAEQPANNPGTCPGDNGKYRVDNKSPPQTYKINCDNKFGGTAISRTVRPNLGSCIDVCSFTPRCKSIDYTPATRQCIFYEAGTRGTTSSPGTHNAYLEVDPSQAGPQQPPTQQPPTQQPPTEQQSGSGGSSQSSAPQGPSPNQPVANIQTVTAPKCPADNGKAWVGADGTWYKIQCGYHVGGNELGKHLGVTNFEECLQKCTETSGCISAQWVGPGTPAPYVNQECTLSDGEGPGERKCEHWFAYTIPPPATADDTPFPYTLCETTCPISDGMIYESETGENFRMSCAKRHGLKVLWTQSTETFDDCMDLCGKVVACHSVDYHARTKKCYLGHASKEPSIPAPGFASAVGIGCAGACKKCCAAKA